MLVLSCEKNRQTNYVCRLAHDNLSKPLSEEIIEFTKKLLKKGVNVKSITKVTGMNENEIKAMQK